ncbi:MAG: hypothetical protein O3A13_12180 [Proteobacteria bacterium]|nr:hypothetical protein [Pseudomonadota bacterium]
MPDVRQKTRLIPNLLLAAFLVAAQWGALVHASEHEAGVPQNQVCKTCVAASQLGTACVDTSPFVEPGHSRSVVHAESIREFKSLHALTARQRGPPSPLQSYFAIDE